MLWRRQQRYAEQALGDNERRLSQQNEMLVAISEAQASYLARGDWRAAAARLLRFARGHSQSESGFFGVILAGPKLRILAHEGDFWSIFARDAASTARPSNLSADEFFELSDFDNVIGAAIQSRRTLVDNGAGDAPIMNSQINGLLRSLLVLPVKAGEKIIGVVSLANRPSGYETEMKATLERLVALAEPVCNSYLMALERGRLSAEQRRAEDQLRASLEEKEVLLREVHHRVKNNLAIISSLLSLQSSVLTDESVREAFRDSQLRVRAMALVHDQLYRSANMSNIDFGAHLRDLAGNVANSYGGPQRGLNLVMDVLNVPLDLDLAIPTSLIVNELLSNAYKHAFKDGRQGEVKVALVRCGEDELEVRVGDSGSGLPRNFDWQAAPTLGLKIVRKLTEQIHGEIAIENGAGTTFIVSFPLKHTRKTDGAAAEL
jgi:two-component sensor histidine kinase